MDPYASPSDPSDFSGPPRTSGKAIASLVLGLTSLICNCVTGIPAIVFGAVGLQEINRSQGRLQGSGLSIAGIVLGSVGSLVSIVMILIALLLPAVSAARTAARRNLSLNNLKMVGLAVMNYESSFRHVPNAYTMDEKGRPLLSWRVAILPFLEENSLQQKFHANEAWDSAANKALISAMPSEFHSPADTEPDSKHTNIVGIVGPDTVLSPDHNISLRDIPDGASNTLVAVELADTGITWTEPRDISIDEFVAAVKRQSGEPGAKPLYPFGVNCLFADGSVRMIAIDTSPDMLRAMCTRSGREPVDVQKY